jgi:hypothetical protein
LGVYWESVLSVGFWTQWALALPEVEAISCVSFASIIFV